jgi:bifunctional pyridoxal-dependent enzyme with beta-cystathionase and maltose regulon repressor activities
LEHTGGWLDAFCRHLTEMRDYTVARLHELDGVTCRMPQGTYVAFADITATGLGSEEVADICRDRARVAVVPGTTRWLGAAAERHVRISFATSHGIMREALDRIADALQRSG